jgi:light-regulated signal transduction histidine kinase (bacteriophytochrome)/CheY-like chemotaxis protein
MSATENAREQPQNLTQQMLLHRIANRIRRSLELQEILSATAAEVRAFLGTDRVKIYQFQPDGHGLVIAESINEDRLPSLLGLHFPADDIPPYARELYVRARQRTIVDLNAQQIGLSPLDCPETGQPLETQDIRYRPVDPCHVEYLTAMGVQSSVVVPIVLESPNTGEDGRQFPSSDRLWGLLASHHSEPRVATEEELAFIQSVVDQVSIAIAQSILLERVREQAQQEANINRVTTLLYTKPTVQLQAALEETVAVFQGSGGRLYLPINDVKQTVEIYTCGPQPERLDRGQGRPIEENLLWQRFLTSTVETSNPDSETKPWSVSWMRAAYALTDVPQESQPDSTIWAIADIYCEPLFRALTPTFQSTQIRGVLIIPLRFGVEAIGCLTIFRDEVDRELIWAGYHNPDTRQLTPRQSFEAWRQIQKGQARAWTEADLRLARDLSDRFSMAARQYRLYQQVQTLNENLEQQVQIRTAELQQSTAVANQQRTLAGILAKMQQLSDVETIFRTTTQEVRQLLNIDRVAVYRFDPDWGGEFINDFGSVSLGWAKIVLATRNIWNDTYLQETQGRRYHNNEVSVVHDIYSAGLSPCHLEILEHYHVRAFLIVPLFVGHQLWGLLAAYQHTSPRLWKETEVTFVKRIAAHLGVALQQANYLDRVRMQTTQLAIFAEQQQALTRVITKIRESLDLDKIFKATTREVRRLLQADRVAVFCFYPQSGCTEGEIISEDVHPAYPSAFGVPIADRCFSEYRAKYRERQFYAIDNVDNDPLPLCYLETLAQFQIQANLVVPLFRGEELWGLLCIHQCSGPRQWQGKEKEFALQIATQLDVALQQAELLHQAQKAREAADAANTAKSEFLANMSHELRTPLNAILGFAQLMTRDSSLSREQKEHLKIIGRSGEHLLSLINDVLEMSKIEAGRATLNERSFDLDRLLHSLYEMLELQARSKGLQLVFERASDIPPYIRTDESKLRQILINLLGNAIKFTEVGRVTLRISSAIARGRFSPQFLEFNENLSTKPAPTIQNLKFEVEDTGPGIAPEELDRLFDAFAQTEAGRRSQEGTGLGLPISRRFVRLMGGDITVESRLGAGSTFQFTIPIHLADGSEVEALQPYRQIVGLEPKQPTYRILVVEDKWANRQLLVQLLAPLGFEVKEATNGQEAIALWEEWQPHLIWMDMRMPGMDGYEATREIKARSRDRAPIILALTANAFEEDRRTALAIGCDDFIHKPCSEEIILGKMAEHLGVCYIYADASEITTDSEPMTSCPLPEPTNIHSFKILVADDNPLNRTLLLQMLKHLGYSADSVSDGLEVLEALHHQAYDLVLMDVQMPQMDGLTATRQIRARGTAVVGPYIIGVTGLALPEEQEECLAAGMDAYLCKPLRLEKLSEALRQFERRAERQKALNPAVLDPEALQEIRVMGGENASAFLLSIVDTYLEEAPKLLQNIREAIAQNQADRLNQMAHSLKGMSIPLGAIAFSQLCQDLEEIGKTGSTTVPSALLERIDTEYERLKLALESERQNVRS